MIEMKKNTLMIRFPEFESLLHRRARAEAREYLAELRRVLNDEFIEPDEDTVNRIESSYARCRVKIDFQRTLRLPDDDKTYPLPAGLGRFPMVMVDDFKDKVPREWVDHGGVIIPMFAHEAMWINFNSDSDCFPSALKVATGKINCVTGESWQPGLREDPQNYLALPRQNWLDGYVVEKGVVRQFVAERAGQGISVEEQLTGQARWNGIQLELFPMRAEDYYEDYVQEELRSRLRSAVTVPRRPRENILFSVMSPPWRLSPSYSSAVDEMSMAAGGRMIQSIVEDSRSVEVYDTDRSARCFVHIVDALQWSRITGQPQPQSPITKETYRRFGIPWFFLFDDGPAVKPSGAFDKVKSIGEMGG